MAEQTLRMARASIESQIKSYREGKISQPRLYNNEFFDGVTKGLECALRSIESMEEFATYGSGSARADSQPALCSCLIVCSVRWIVNAALNPPKSVSKSLKNLASNSPDTLSNLAIQRPPNVMPFSSCMAC